MDRLERAYRRILRESIDLKKLDDDLAAELEQFNSHLPAAQDFLESRGFEEDMKSAGKSFVKKGRTITAVVVLMNSKTGSGISAAGEVFLTENYDDLRSRTRLFCSIVDDEPSTDDPGMANVKAAYHQVIGFLNALTEDAESIEFD